MQKLKTLKVKDNNMSPLLKKGDLAIYKSKPPSKIEVDDIVVTKIDNITSLSRIIYKNNSFLIVKQDKVKTPLKINSTGILGVAVTKKSRNQSTSLDNIYLSQYLVYLKEINRLNKILINRNINFLYLKGVPLYLHILNRPLRRFFLDCDLLVSQKDLKKFENILIQEGFEKINTDLSPAHTKLKDKITEISYSKTIQGIPIILDVHYEIVFMMNQLGKLEMFYPQNKINSLTNSFLRHKKNVKINSNKYPLLSDLHLILYLALHIFHHNYRGYNRYDFFNHVIKKTPINWPDLKKIISNFNFENYIYFTFFYYQKFYGHQFPENYLSSLAPKNKTVLKIIGKINIFEEESRIKSGINRFLYLFLLSPIPWHKKLLAFKNTAVLVSIFVVLKKIILKNPSAR